MPVVNEIDGSPGVPPTRYTFRKNEEKKKQIVCEVVHVDLD